MMLNKLITNNVLSPTCKYYQDYNKDSWLYSSKSIVNDCAQGVTLPILKCITTSSKKQYCDFTFIK